MAISFLTDQSINDEIKFGGDITTENYATLTMVSQGLELSVGDPANTNDPLVHFDGAYSRVLVGSITQSTIPYLRIGASNAISNQSSRLELAESATGTGLDMNYGYSFNQNGNGNNKLEIKRHNNSTAGSTVITLERDHSNVTFAGALTVNGTNITVANASNPYLYLNDTNGGAAIFQQSGNDTRIGSDGNTLVKLIQNNAVAVTIDTSKNAFFTGDVSLVDNKKLNLGNSDDLQIYHDGSNSYITNTTGDIYFQQNKDDGDVYFQCDNGSGGLTNYFYLDGGIESIMVNKDMLLFNDGNGGKLKFGASQDLEIYHDGSHSRIKDTGTGSLTINATDFVVNNSGDTQNMIIAVDGGATTLFCAGVGRLATTSGGVSVTGGISTSGNATINGGNINVNGSYPRINMYSTDAGEDDWSIINNNGIFGIYNKTEETYAVSITETVNTVVINSGNLQLNGTGRITGVDTVSASTDAANKAYVDAHTSGVEVINEGVGIKKSGSSTSVTISVNYDSGDTDNLIFGANPITAAVATKPYTPYILAADSNPGISFGEVKSLRLEAIPLDRFADATATIDMGGNKILDVANPTLAQDAATKAYVDANSGSGTVTGTGASTRVAFWSSSSALTSDADLTYATATNRLSSGNYIIPNNGDYLGTDTSGNARTLISLTNNNDVEISNAALSSGSDTMIFYGDTFKIMSGGGASQKFTIASNGTMSNLGNTFNSGPINLSEDNKITFDDDGDQWNWIQATGGEMEMAVGQTLTLTNVEENMFGEIKVAVVNTILGGNVSTSNATYLPIYTDSASSTVPRRQRVQTPSQFLSNAGAITGSGTSGRVAFFTGTRTQSSDTLYWNSSANVLGINYNGNIFNNGALQIQGPTTNTAQIGLQIYNSTTGSPYGSHGIFVNGPRYGNAGISIKNPNVGTTFMRFYNSSGSSVGTITQNGTSSTSYNTSSDYRLKENIIPMTGSIDRLKQLKPSRFNFIDDNKENRGAIPTVDGFIAHEVSDIIPEAITGEKDGVDYEGNPEYQSIDQAKIVPLLTGALQEAISKIESLEARIKALES